MADKVKIRVPEKEKDENGYYLKLAGKFRVLKYIFGIAFIVFLVVMLVAFRESITYENLQYMLRDLSAARYDSDFSSIDFGNEDISFASIYRGEILTAGKKEVSLYSVSGNKTLGEEISMSLPRVEASEKYFLVFDAKGKTYSVYNSYSKLHSESFEYTVTDACISDSGSYAVVSSTREYPYAVYLYNKDFKRIGEYFKNKYLMDVSLSGDGTRLLILSFLVEDGDFVTEVSTYTAMKEGSEQTFSIPGAFPVAGRVFNDGSSLIITDLGAYLFSPSGTRTAEVSASGRDLTGFAFGDRYSVMLFRENRSIQETRAVIFDTNGDVLYNSNVEETVRSASVSEDLVCLLCEDSVISVKPADGTVRKASCEEGGISVVIMRRTGGEPRVTVCYSDCARSVEFETEVSAEVE
ncbi:MAG: hypothetical protein J5933_05665 [Clostridia bacterium]|nr:hypothetical protein [Clostridia bacterium]